MIDSNDCIGQVAIVGMAGRFPGAKNLDEFWQNLRDGVESISFFSNEELESPDLYQNWRNHPNYVKAKAVLEDAELFDAAFFGYSPREAEIMDPQSRIFLEVAWDALESAGYNSEIYQGRIGVYAGASVNTYLLFNLLSNSELVTSLGLQQIHVNNQIDTLTTRTAYKLNLQSAGVTVQTACSTSLVAVHLACQSLLSGECDLVLAGGVSITVPQKSGYFYQEGGIFSPDGHCRAFDAKAQGTVSGNGVGIVVLKRLGDALADGDRIHAIIKGSAINNDGALKVGYTAPSVDGQAKVIAEAQAIAGIEPETISYVEAHGTGTALGDPIEIAALTQAFRAGTQKRGFCAIGSVKTNFGHLSAAAGVTGLIKTVLALQYKQIPPSLHFQQPNPQIDFARSPFYVNSTLSEWQANGTPRRAGVSSFGIGGTNAHVILEEAPTVEASKPSRPWQLLLLSAKTSSALKTATVNLVKHFQQHPHLNLADVSYTLQVGRRAFDYRRMVVCRDVGDAVQVLETPDLQRVFTHFSEPCNRQVAFMFPGQGSQYVDMGRELYQTEPIFREWVDHCSELLEPHLGLDLRHILYPSEARAGTAAEQLTQTAIAQSALFVIEYALAQLWMAWGVRPVAVIGHSIGEYVAACLAGVFSLEEALFVVAVRGQLMQQLPTGAMLSVSLSEEEVQPLLCRELSMATNNAQSLCVVSGSTEAIAALQARLTAQGVDCRRLHTSHAFHSQMMDSIIEPFAEQIGKVTLKPPQIPFLSNVTGKWIMAAEATNPRYWARHLRETVRFSQGIAELVQQPERILLEVGPGRTLSTFAKRYQVQEQVVLTSMRHPNEKHSDVAFLLNTLGRLWLAGFPVDWSGFYAHEQRHRIPLPTYPFERQRYWISPQTKAENATHRQTKKPNIADWFYIPSWKRSLISVQTQPIASKIEKKSCWLVFIDAIGVGGKIAKQLELNGYDVITVAVGEQFTQLSDHAYTINPQQRDDYDILLEKLRALDWTPNAVAHLWTITLNESVRSQIQFFKNCQNLGFYSLLFLAQALGKQEIANPLQILVVTNNIQDVNGDERLCPEKATVLGMCKVIPQEYPNITCRSIDVAMPESGTENQLIKELTLESSENVVAYRGKHRWVQTFEPVQLDEAPKEKIPLREGGVYLITGGLSGIGLVLAEYLARTVRAKLILIGRKYVNPQSKIQNPKFLESFGAEVLVKSADVANKEQMEDVIASATERFGTIHGVIHAADVRSINTVQAISRAECEQQFQAKVQGLFVLEEVLHGRELDFCLLMSSLASVLGLLGKAAYPAANIFMDAFAHKHNQTNPVRWISVNWDNWLIAETAELDMAAKTLQWYMTPQEGIEAFQRILSANTLTQVVVSTGDLQARRDRWNQQQSSLETEIPQKVDSLSLHSRPNLQNTYVAPRNQVEQTLADIWQQLLGIQQVGIHDNFFELGGDSVLGIQLIAKADRAGFQLNTKQVFECQTIAELAAVASKKIGLAEQGLVTGLISLTPIQHWFFEQNQPEPHHWNQAVWLEVQQSVDPALLEQALQQLLVHHDALRLRFKRSESGWQQVNASSQEVVPFTRLDLSAVSPDAQISAMKAAATELHTTLNLSEGSIVQVVFFDLGAQSSSYLLIIVHHLAVDVVSWRILLQDFQTAYQQLVEGQAIQLPAKTTSFKHWAERLKQYTESAEVRRELEYWLAASRDRVPPLPVDYPEGANTIASAQTVSVALSVEETQVLLQQVPAVYRTQTEEVLLAAIRQAFARWTGVPSLLVDLERSGRDVIFDDIDLSRTVGWFTTIFPVLLSLGEEANNPGEALKSLKEQLRRISREGIGYGVLRYLSQEAAIAEKFRSLPQAEVIFLYLGQFGESLPQSSLFRLTRKFSGSERSPRGIRPHLLQITGLVERDQLQVSWTYNENVHRRSTVENLAHSFVEALRLLLTHCQSSEAGSYTPSDFSAAKISQKDLSKLLAQASKFGGMNSQ